MKKFFTKPFLIIYTIVLLIAFLSFISMHKVSTHKRGSDIGVVKRENLIKTITISGKVSPNRKTLITAPYDGYTKKIYVKLGDQVKAGDPLVTIVKSLQISEKEFPLRAPYDGTVVLLPKSEGEYISKGASTEASFIMRIDDLTQLFVDASVPEVNILNLKLGQKANIKATPILNKTYEGVIQTISLANEDQRAMFGQSQTTYPIQLKIINPDGELRSGMSILADIIAAKKDNVLVLAHEYIHRDEAQYYVILENGKRRDIKLGLQNNQYSEILEGLDEGDEVKQVNYLGDE